jgi:hypothetical protein
MIHPSFVIASHVLKVVFMMLKKDFSNIFVRFNSPRKLLQGFKSSDIHIRVNGLTT